MNEPLHPSTLGEILDRTAQLYRSRFLLFLGISFVPTGVLIALFCAVGLVVGWWSVAGASSIAAPEGYVLVALFVIAVTLVALPVLMAATALGMAALSHAASRINLGQVTTIRDAYKSVWRRGWRYTGLYLLQILVIGGIPFAVWIALLFITAGLAAFAGKSGAGGILGGALFGLIMVLVIIVLIGYVFWMLLRLSLAFPACVVEQIGAWPAIKRSSQLSNGTKGRIFVLYLLGAVLSFLLSMGITLPLTIVLALLPGMGNEQYAQTAAIVMTIIIYGASFAVQALIHPIYGISFVLFYYDQRIRMEGFDIEWMMLKAGLTPAQPLQQSVKSQLDAKPVSETTGEL
jgi:hypothetical protein